eukprot:GHRR01016768.1.p2 GENE.GHRR01016768.1~~GHRR01016768.1.p2  ORF type:complete len:130 (-),score=22.08 GHRR01016768.1:734-1123(-)
MISNAIGGITCTLQSLLKTTSRLPLYLWLARSAYGNLRPLKDVRVHHNVHNCLWAVYLWSIGQYLAIQLQSMGCTIHLRCCKKQAWEQLLPSNLPLLTNRKCYWSWVKMIIIKAKRSNNEKEQQQQPRN